MIDSIEREKIVVNDEPLPPAWLRSAGTEPDDDADVRAEIYRIGPQGRFRSSLIEAVEQSEDVVLLASFLFSDQELAKALVDAAERGVRVYALTSTETKLAQIQREDSDFDARMLAEHKELLDLLAGRVLLRSAAHFHAKFLIVDPKGSPRGFVSTANFNRALQDGVELGIELGRRAVGVLAGWFAWAFWTEAERELVERGRLRSVNAPPAVPSLPTDLRTIVPTTKSHQHLREAALKLIRGAKRRLIVASYSLDADHISGEALIERARAGVEVIVLTRPRPAVEEAVRRLVEAGVRVIAHDKLHAKAIYSDVGALIMTANIEAHGLDDGFEIGVLLTSRNARAALDEILSQWVDNFPWRFAAGARPSEHLGEIWFADKGARDVRPRVVESVDVRLKPVIADDALDLEAMSPPALTPPKDPKTIARSFRYVWQVQPPRLPTRAVEEKRVEVRREKGKDGKTKSVDVKVPFDPPVYRAGKRRYVLVRNAHDTKPARKLAAQLGARVVVK